jgi:antirestriction protein ArdC/phage/plasmid primase-like uncharacterized protein
MVDRRDPTGEVLEAMRAAGCEPADPGVIAFDGRLHRYDVAGDQRGRKNGWFALHDGIVPYGAFGSWKTDVTQTWRATATVELTPEQRRLERARIKAAQAQRLAEQRRLQARARERAATLWDRARPAVNACHPYLIKKQVPAIGLRQLGELLVAPVRDGDGTLLSLEFLNPEGGKKFLKEGAVEGGHHWLGDPAGSRTILVCEGYATGASLHRACGLPVAIAFSGGNLFPVARDIHRRYPDAALVIAGDDDRHATGNPGRRHAEETARWVNGAAILPDFAGLDPSMRPTDFNDVQVLGGLAHLRRQLETRLAAVLPAETARPVAAMAVPAAMGTPGRRRKTHRGDGGRPNLYREVTDRIVEMIEAGTAPWQRPWDRVRHSSAPAFPVNAATDKTYRGVNVLLLGADPRTAGDPRWCGYEQAKARGWQVRAGARGATIYFFKRLEIPEAGEGDAEPPLDEDGRPLGRTVPLLRRHTVFHASQIEGIPSLEEAYGPVAALPDHVWEAEDRLERILRRSGARIVHGGNRAYYDPGEDFVALPPRERFPSVAAFFGVAFHELGHWTGHETRLNRPFARRRDAPDYAREELRAELASAFLGAELGIQHDLEQHATYLERYLGLLRGDNREIFRASRDAQAIADLILDRHPTWQLKDGVCARRIEPPAKASDEAETATADGTPEAASPTEAPDPRREASPVVAAALPAPYQWAFAALSDPEAALGDGPLDGLSRRIDAALPLAEVSRTGDAAECPPALSDLRALGAAHHP